MCSGGKWRAVLRSIICVVADIFDEADAWTLFLVHFCDAYTLAHASAHTDQSLITYQDSLMELWEASQSTLKLTTASMMRYIKNHTILCHSAAAIPVFGVGGNYDADWAEYLHRLLTMFHLYNLQPLLTCLWHRVFIKTPYRRTSGANHEVQLLNFVNRWCLSINDGMVIEVLADGISYVGNSRGPTFGRSYNYCKKLLSKGGSLVKSGIWMWMGSLMSKNPTLRREGHCHSQF